MLQQVLKRPRPLDWYGKSKLAAEQALHALDGHLPVMCHFGIR